MKKHHLSTLVGIIIGFLVMAAIAAERGEKHEGPQQVPLTQVPVQARTALTRLAGENKILGVIAENDEGVVTYKGLWRVAGKAHSAVLTVDGALTSTEEIVEGQEVPPEVRKAADKLLPGAQNVTFERLTNVSYEIFGAIGGKKKTYEVSPTGALAEHKDHEAREGHEGREKGER